MTTKKNEFLMDADFQCIGCGSILGVRVSLPAVKATGVEVTCRHCQARYLVTESGAVPTDGHISGGVPHGHFAWDESITHEPLKGEDNGGSNRGSGPGIDDAGSVAVSDRVADAEGE